MKLTKNSNILLVGLALILSLVSFTGVANHLPSEVIKTALVVSDTSKDTRFSIPYHKAYSIAFASFVKYSDYSFTKFQKDYNIKAITAFKTNTCKTLGFRATQLHTKLYIYSTHQTLYNDII